LSIKERNLHPFISNFIDNNVFLVIYGPPATGKTHLAFEISKYLINKRKDFVFLATEAQTFTYGKYFIYDVPLKLVVTKEQLLKEIIEGIESKKYIIIDSINYLFRTFNDDTSEKELSFISSLLSIVGGFATGQITQEDFDSSKMSMDTWIIPWAKAIGITNKLNEKVVELKLLKPRKVILGYEIIRDGVKWI
jgi:DNA polymerase III delta prime subunit